MGDLLKIAVPIAGIFGAKSSSDATKAQANAVESASRYQSDKLSELASPYLGQARYTFPRLQNLISSYYEPQVGQDDATLKTQHQANLGNIGLQEEQSLANARRYWGAAGNLSRGRGEALKILRNAAQATNTENLSYRQAQNNYKDKSAARLEAALNSLVGLSAPGIGLLSGSINAQANGATNAANIRGKANRGFWDDVLKILS